jgi:leucyl aminopeptidase
MTLTLHDLLPPSRLLPGEEGSRSVPLWLASDKTLAEVIAALPAGAAQWLRTQAFRADRQQLIALPDAEGQLAGAILGLGNAPSLETLDPWLAATLPERLPAANYRVATELGPRAATHFALGWLLGSHPSSRFRSKATPVPGARLVTPRAADARFAQSAAEAAVLARELINAPANALGPDELASVAGELAAHWGGECTVVRGDELASGYPLISAVGMGSARPPCLIDLRWPRSGAPAITVVGKGVCFDSGGLDIKPAAGMLLMKKDMGGAACALALAHLLRSQDLPVSLRVLIPAVENSVGSRAFRPGDVWPSRKGLRVEIGNTDAEGRLILADALTEADAGKPDLLVDLATLTGAARVALGPELPAVFSNRAELLDAARTSGDLCADPVWPMPLWDGYDDELNSRIGDLNNVSNSPFAGSVIAALFLRRFVSPATAWMHFDLYAWNARERPGRPAGAEAQCVRTLHDMIRDRFC